MIFVTAVGASTKKAYLNAKEEDLMWSDYDETHIQSVSLTKRYFIVSTESFSSKEEAINFVKDFDFTSIKYRKNTSGTLILPDNTYLFFTLP